MEASRTFARSGWVIGYLALAALVPAPAIASHKIVGRGHITAAGPWTSSRSLTVLLDRDGVDGFFLMAPPPGTNIGTSTVDRSGRGYDLSLNFHRGTPTGAGPRPWLGGCSTAAIDERNCVVPEGAGTVEVTGTRGVDLDVTVFIEHKRRS